MLLRISALVELLLHIFENKNNENRGNENNDNENGIDREDESEQNEETEEVEEEEECPELLFEVSEKAIRIAHSILDVSFGQLCK